MNGSDTNYQPSPDLPMPSHEATKPMGAEASPNPLIPVEKVNASPEMPVNSMPTTNQPTPVGPSPLVPPPMPAVSTGSAVPAPIPIPVNDVPSAADDSDLIEKEWVNKAKHIVEATRDDPHLQNKEINKFKADYIQKRYNKQLKVSDD